MYLQRASDAKEAMCKVMAARPDVVVLDVPLPRIDGRELARRLRHIIPEDKLIAFSNHSSEEYVVRIARCGVRGYVTKDQPAGNLLEAIKQVFGGKLRFPDGMIGAILEPAPKSPSGIRGGAGLTKYAIAHGLTVL